MNDDVRRTFALFIAAAGPGRAAEGARAAAGTEAITLARTRWSGRLFGPTISRKQVEEALGPSDESDVDVLGYHLPGYPDHVYTFEFDDRGYQRRACFRRRGEKSRVPAPPSDLSARSSYLRALAALGVAEEELTQSLGEPIAREGWWPCETLHFDDGLEIELLHGLVLAD